MMRKIRDDHLGIIIVTLSCLIIVVLSALYPVEKTLHRREITATVTEKTIKYYTSRDNTGKGKSTYLIFAKDEAGEVQVFEVTDSLFAWRFNSSDVYAGIEIGKTYIFNVGGYRLPLLSWYPNIYRYEECESERK